MVETEVELVKGEALSEQLPGLPCRVFVNILVVNLQASKDGVVKAHINANNVLHQRV